MNKNQFIKIGQKITGVTHGYQAPLAKRLGVCLRMVQHYANGTRPITETIELLMKELNKEGK